LIGQFLGAEICGVARLQMRPPSVSPSLVSRRRAIIVSVDKRMDISFATVTFKGPEPWGPTADL
jgi:hypothetical protein